MTEIVVGVRLVASGDSVVGQIRELRAEVTQLGGAGKSAAAGVSEMAAATGRVVDAAGRATTATKTASAAAGEMAGETERVGDAANRVAPALDRSANAARAFSAGLKDTSNTSRTGSKALEDTNEALVQQAKNAGMARAGWMGVGYQMQDVFASYGSGIKLSTIFAQQSGQLSSAISMIAAASGKTEGAVGRFATFMGGGWGIAVGVGVSVLTALWTVLGDTSDATAEADKKAYDFTHTLNYWELGARKTADAMRDLADATRSAIVEQGDFREAQLANAVAAEKAAAARLEQNQRALRRSEQDAGSFTLDPTEVYRRIEQRGQLRAAIEDDQQALNAAKQARLNLEIGLSQQKVNDSLDAGAAAMTRFRQAIGDLEARRRETEADPIAAQNSGRALSQEAYDREYARLKTKLEAERKAARDAARQDKASNNQVLANFSSPLSGYRLTGRFGEDRRDHRHAGIDMAASMGTPVYATQAGTVSFAGNAGSYGNLIKIGHGAGTETRYGHLSRIAVSDNQAVAKGDLIGNVGSTGRSSGAHLHYEVRVNGKPVDPTKGAFPIDEAKVAENAQKAADDLKAFGERAESSIAQINAQFDDQPRLIDAAAKAMRDLDGLEDDLAKRPLTPNIEALKASIAETRTTIAEGMIRPYTEFLQTARQSAEIDALVLAGRHEEAEALQVVLRLQAQAVPLSEDQLQAVRDTVEAERERGKVLAQQQDQIGAYLDATRSVRSEIEAIFAGQGKLSNFKTIARQLQARMITEQLFGPALRSLEDHVRRNTFGPAVDQLTRDTDDAGQAVSDFATTVREAMGRIEGATASVGSSTPARSSGKEPLGAVGPAIVTPEDVAAIFNGQTMGWHGKLNPPYVLSARGGSGPEGPAADEIVVEGRRAGKSTVTGMTPNAFFEEMMRRLTSPLLDGLDDLLGVKFFAGLKGVMSGAISGYLTAGPAGGILGALKEIPGLPEGISKALGKSLKGAETGTMTAGVMKSLGIKTSTTGAQIGGAIGAAIPIPGGDVIGSILGGLIGGAFKKTKWGSATIGNVDGVGDVTGTAGNSKSRITAANGLAGNALSALDQVIEQLNGELGDFSASIGVRKKKFVVDPTGQGRTKGSGVLKYSTEQEAQAALLADIFADGAVKGVSEAVAKALRSSTDVDKAVKEALKVQDVELALGGIGAKVAAEFKTFERTAGERLRIAEKYGFDLVKMEERNAADRAKLTKELLADQVGGLQRLVDEMTGGSLFEGSAVDKRQSLLAAISAAQASADAGDEGAADKLAELLEELAAVSKEVFGTTAGYANDRANILDRARETIEKANQRIFDAQTTSDPALATTNAALDELNDQTARMLAAAGLTNELLAQLIAQGIVPGSSTLADLARTTAR